MEIILALAGIAGLALLVQSKPLPSEEDVLKAEKKLLTDPDDPDANTIIGKQLAFALGDYQAAMPYLAKSSNKTLKTLAEHELDPSYTDTAVKKVGMGDDWVTAAKKFQALYRIFYDRASKWYSQAWPNLEGIWKDKLRERGRQLATSKPPGASKKALPTGWIADPGISGSPSVLDGNIARTGSFSVQLLPADEKVPGSASVFRSALIPVNGKSMETSVHVLTDGTENGADGIFILFFNENGAEVGRTGSFYPIDFPFWTRISVKADVPKNAVRATFGVNLYSKKGSAWIDDVSMKIDGKESLSNLSFEEK